MTSKKVIYTVLIGLLSISSSAQSLKKTVEGNNTFAFELFREVFDKEKNTFISPYSISTALAMTYAGARNETERQMSTVLHFDLYQKNTHEGFLAIDKELNNSKADTSLHLNVVNALWKDKNYPFNEDFLELTKKYYDAPVFDLAGASPVNDWVSKGTHGKIRELVSDASLENVRLLLTNAIYFKGSWLEPFNPRFTVKENFTTVQNTEVGVGMMFQETTVNYFEDDQKQVIELPYKGEMISMILILPNTSGSVASLVNRLDSKVIDDIRQSYKKLKVNIHIPKFTFTSEFNLKETLSGMGMPDAFNASVADFSGMGRGLFIGEVKHKSFIEVNEKGSEAAATTGVMMVGTAMMQKIIFRADHPFLFIIRDNQTGSILFIGSMLDPEKI